MDSAPLEKKLTADDAASRLNELVEQAKSLNLGGKNKEAEAAIGQAERLLYRFQDDWQIQELAYLVFIRYFRIAASLWDEDKRNRPKVKQLLYKASVIQRDFKSLIHIEPGIYQDYRDLLDEVRRTQVSLPDEVRVPHLPKAGQPILKPGEGEAAKSEQELQDLMDRIKLASLHALAEIEKEIERFSRKKQPSLLAALRERRDVLLMQGQRLSVTTPRAEVEAGKEIAKDRDKFPQQRKTVADLIRAIEAGTDELALPKLKAWAHKGNQEAIRALEAFERKEKKKGKPAGFGAAEQIPTLVPWQIEFVDKVKPVVIAMERGRSEAKRLKALRRLEDILKDYTVATESWGLKGALHLEVPAPFLGGKTLPKLWFAASSFDYDKSEIDLIRVMDLDRSSPRVIKRDIAVEERVDDTQLENFELATQFKTIEPPEARIDPESKEDVTMMFSPYHKIAEVRKLLKNDPEDMDGLLLLSDAVEHRRSADMKAVAVLVHAGEMRLPELLRMRRNGLKNLRNAYIVVNAIVKKELIRVFKSPDPEVAFGEFLNSFGQDIELLSWMAGRPVDTGLVPKNNRGSNKKQLELLPQLLPVLDRYGQRLLGDRGANTDQFERWAKHIAFADQIRWVALRSPVDINETAREVKRAAGILPDDEDQKREVDLIIKSMELVDEIVSQVPALKQQPSIEFNRGWQQIVDSLDVEAEADMDRGLNAARMVFEHLAGSIEGDELRFRWLRWLQDSAHNKQLSSDIALVGTVVLLEPWLRAQNESALIKAVRDTPSHLVQVSLAYLLVMHFRNLNPLYQIRSNEALRQASEEQAGEFANTVRALISSDPGPEWGLVEFMLGFGAEDVSSGTNKLIVTRDRGVAAIVLNSPGTNNALDSEKIRAITDTLKRLEQEPEISFVIFKGADGKDPSRKPFFSAGGDIKERQRYLQAARLDDLRPLVREKYEMLRTMHRFKKPIISLVDGIAVGGGLGIVLASDLAFATRGSSFMLPETRLGWFADAINTPLLARLYRLGYDEWTFEQEQDPLLGKPFAKYFGFTGKEIQAREAAHYGLVWDVVDDLLTVEEVLKGLLDGTIPAEKYGKGFDRHQASHVVRELFLRYIGGGQEKVTDPEVLEILASEPGLEGPRDWFTVDDELEKSIQARRRLIRKYFSQASARKILSGLIRAAGPKSKVNGEEYHFARETLAMIADRSPEAILETNRLIEENTDLYLSGVIEGKREDYLDKIVESEVEAGLAMIASEDLREGIDAFVNRRKPGFPSLKTPLGLLFKRAEKVLATRRSLIPRGVNHVVFATPRGAAMDRLQESVMKALREEAGSKSSGFGVESSSEGPPSKRSAAVPVDEKNADSPELEILKTTTDVTQLREETVRLKELGFPKSTLSEILGSRLPDAYHYWTIPGFSRRGRQRSDLAGLLKENWFTVAMFFAGFSLYLYGLATESNFSPSNVKDLLAIFFSSSGFRGMGLYFMILSIFTHLIPITTLFVHRLFLEDFWRERIEKINIFVEELFKSTNDRWFDLVEGLWLSPSDQKADFVFNNYTRLYSGLTLFAVMLPSAGLGGMWIFRPGWIITHLCTVVATIVISFFVGLGKRQIQREAKEFDDSIKLEREREIASKPLDRARDSAGFGTEISSQGRFETSDDAAFDIVRLNTKLQSEYKWIRQLLILIPWLSYASSLVGYITHPIINEKRIQSQATIARGKLRSRKNLLANAAPTVIFAISSIVLATASLPRLSNRFILDYLRLLREIYEGVENIRKGIESQHDIDYLSNTGDSQFAAQPIMAINSNVGFGVTSEDDFRHFIRWAQQQAGLSALVDLHRRAYREGSGRSNYDYVNDITNLLGIVRAKAGPGAYNGLIGGTVVRIKNYGSATQYQVDNLAPLNIGDQQAIIRDVILSIDPFWQPPANEILPATMVGPPSKSPSVPATAAKPSQLMDRQKKISEMLWWGPEDASLAKGTARVTLSKFIEAHELKGAKRFKLVAKTATPLFQRPKDTRTLSQPNEVFYPQSGAEVKILEITATTVVFQLHPTDAGDIRTYDTRQINISDLRQVKPILSGFGTESFSLEQTKEVLQKYWANGQHNYLDYFRELYYFRFALMKRRGMYSFNTAWFHNARGDNGKPIFEKLATILAGKVHAALVSTEAREIIERVNQHQAKQISYEEGRALRRILHKSLFKSDGFYGERMVSGMLTALVSAGFLPAAFNPENPPLPFAPTEPPPIPLNDNAYLDLAKKATNILKDDKGEMQRLVRLILEKTGVSPFAALKLALGKDSLDAISLDRTEDPERFSDPEAWVAKNFPPRPPVYAEAISEQGKETLVLLHGAALDKTAWGANVLNELAKKYRLIRVDLTGHGKSTGPEMSAQNVWDSSNSHYNLDLIAADVKRALDQLGIKRATFVGHSAGGKIILSLATQYPGLVERATVIDLGFRRYLGTELADFVEYGILRSGSKAAYSLFRAAGARDMSNELDLIREQAIPLQVIASDISWEHLPFFSPADQEHLLEHYPEAHVNRVTGPPYRHNVYQSHPDEFLRLLTEFVDTTPSAPVSKAAVITPMWFLFKLFMRENRRLDDMAVQWDRPEALNALRNEVHRWNPAENELALSVFVIEKSMPVDWTKPALIGDQDNIEDTFHNSPIRAIAPVAPAEIMEAKKEGVFLGNSKKTRLMEDDFIELRRQASRAISSGQDIEEVTLELSRLNWKETFKIINFHGWIYLLPARWAGEQSSIQIAFEKSLVQEDPGQSMIKGDPIIVLPAAHLLFRDVNGKIEPHLVGDHYPRRMVILHESLFDLTDRLQKKVPAGGIILLQVLMGHQLRHEVFRSNDFWTDASFWWRDEELFGALAGKAGKQLSQALYEEGVFDAETRDGLPSSILAMYWPKDHLLPLLVKRGLVDRGVIQNGSRVLEVGTGPGMLTRAMAAGVHYAGIKDVQFVANDISRDALMDAMRFLRMGIGGFRNIELRSAKKTGWESAMTWTLGLKDGELFDVILWNPPWYARRRNGDAARVEAWSDPLHKELNSYLDEMKPRLTPTGKIYVVFPRSRSATLRKLAREHSLTISEADAYETKRGFTALYEFAPIRQAGFGAETEEILAQRGDIFNQAHNAVEKENWEEAISIFTNQIPLLFQNHIELSDASVLSHRIVKKLLISYDLFIHRYLHSDGDARIAHKVFEHYLNLFEKFQDTESVKTQASWFVSSATLLSDRLTFAGRFAESDEVLRHVEKIAARFHADKDVRERAVHIFKRILGLAKAIWQSEGTDEINKVRELLERAWKVKTSFNLFFELDLQNKFFALRDEVNASTRSDAAGALPRPKPAAKPAAQDPVKEEKENGDKGRELDELLNLIRTASAYKLGEIEANDVPRFSNKRQPRLIAAIRERRATLELQQPPLPSASHRAEETKPHPRSQTTAPKKSGRSLAELERDFWNGDTLALDKLRARAAKGDQTAKAAVEKIDKKLSKRSSTGFGVQEKLEQRFQALRSAMGSFFDGAWPDLTLLAGHMREDADRSLNEEIPPVVSAFRGLLGDRFEAEFGSYWRDMVDVGLAAGDNTRRFFRASLPRIMKVFGQDMTTHWGNLMSLGRTVPDRGVFFLTTIPMAANLLGDDVVRSLLLETFRQEPDVRYAYWVSHMRQKVRQRLKIRESAFVVVAGSTQVLEEDEVIIQAVEKLRKEMNRKILLILAPRGYANGSMRSDVALVRSYLEANKFDYILRAPIEDAHAPTLFSLGGFLDDGILVYNVGQDEGPRKLVEGLGELAAVYAAADVAIVGGNIIEQHGHNVAEPINFNVPTITGSKDESPSIRQFKSSGRLTILEEEGPADIERSLVSLLRDSLSSSSGFGAVDEGTDGESELEINRRGKALLGSADSLRAKHRFNEALNKSAEADRVFAGLYSPWSVLLSAVDQLNFYRALAYRAVSEGNGPVAMTIFMERIPKITERLKAALVDYKTRMKKDFQDAQLIDAIRYTVSTYGMLIRKLRERGDDPEQVKKVYDHGVELSKLIPGELLIQAKAAEPLNPKTNPPPAKKPQTPRDPGFNARLAQIRNASLHRLLEIERMDDHLGAEKQAVLRAVIERRRETLRLQSGNMPIPGTRGNETKNHDMAGHTLKPSLEIGKSAPDLERAALQGDGYAQNKLIAWAHRGNPAAISALGKLAKNGNERAVQTLEILARRENSEAIRMLHGLKGHRGKSSGFGVGHETKVPARVRRIIQFMREEGDLKSLLDEAATDDFSDRVWKRYQNNIQKTAPYYYFLLAKALRQARNYSLHHQDSFSDVASLMGQPAEIAPAVMKIINAEEKDEVVPYNKLITVFPHYRQSAVRALPKEKVEEFFNFVVHYYKLELEFFVPDLVFRPESGMVFSHKGKNYVFLSNFSSEHGHGERIREAKFNRDWFKARGYEVIEMPASLPFESADVKFVKHGDSATIIFGWGYRSSRRAIHQIVKKVERIVGKAVFKKKFEIILAEEITEDAYHIDTALKEIPIIRRGKIVDETIMYHPGAFSPETQRVLRERFPGAVILSDVDAKNFAANSVTIGKSIIMDDRVSGALEAELIRRGMKVVRVNLLEFYRSGGGSKCLVLELDRNPFSLDVEDNKFFQLIESPQGIFGVESIYNPFMIGQIGSINKAEADREHANLVNVMREEGAEIDFLETKHFKTPYDAQTLYATVFGVLTDSGIPQEHRVRMKQMIEFLFGYAGLGKWLALYLENDYGINFRRTVRGHFTSSQIRALGGEKKIDESTRFFAQVYNRYYNSSPELSFSTLMLSVYEEVAASGHPETNSAGFGTSGFLLGADTIFPEKSRFNRMIKKLNGGKIVRTIELAGNTENVYPQLVEKLKELSPEEYVYVSTSLTQSRNDRIRVVHSFAIDKVKDFLGKRPMNLRFGQRVEVEDAARNFISGQVGLNDFLMHYSIVEFLEEQSIHLINFSVGRSDGSQDERHFSKWQNRGLGTNMYNRVAAVLKTRFPGWKISTFIQLEHPPRTWFETHFKLRQLTDQELLDLSDTLGWIPKQTKTILVGTIPKKRVNARKNSAGFGAGDGDLPKAPAARAKEFLQSVFRTHRSFREAGDMIDRFGIKAGDKILAVGPGYDYPPLVAAAVVGAHVDVVQPEEHIPDSGNPDKQLAFLKEGIESARSTINKAKGRDIIGERIDLHSFPVEVQDAELPRNYYNAVFLFNVLDDPRTEIYHEAILRKIAESIQTRAVLLLSSHTKPFDTVLQVVRKHLKPAGVKVTVTGKKFTRAMDHTVVHEIILEKIASASAGFGIIEAPQTASTGSTVLITSNHKQYIDAIASMPQNLRRKIFNEIENIVVVMPGDREGAEELGRELAFKLGLARGKTRILGLRDASELKGEVVLQLLKQDLFHFGEEEDLPESLRFITSGPNAKVVKWIDWASKVQRQVRMAA